MKRRDFLKSTAETALDTFPINPGQTASTLASSAPSQPRSQLIRTTTGIEPYRGPWNEKTAAHLLRRTIFGPTRAEIADAQRRSLDEVLGVLYQDQPLPEPPINPATGQTWVNSAYDSTNDGVYRNYLKAWWLGFMIRQGVSIREKMVLFWHNHFATETADVQDSRYMYVQNALFRQQLGSSQDGETCATLPLLALNLFHRITIRRIRFSPQPTRGR